MNPIDNARHLMAFRLGQADAILRTLTPIDAIQAPPLAHPLALRLLRRLWLQYREDRALECPASLAAGENLLERSHFLGLLDTIIDEKHWVLRDAVRTVNAVCTHADSTQLTDWTHDEDYELVPAVSRNLHQITARANLLPDERLARLLEAFRYSTGPGPGATPCWALNLVCALRAEDLGLVASPLPFPGLLRREMLRADRTPAWQRFALVRSITASAEVVMAETVELENAARGFDEIWPDLRTNSRLADVYHVLSGLSELTATQVSRALEMSEPGARKLLLQLERGGFARRAEVGAKWVSTTLFRIGRPKHRWLREIDESALDDAMRLLEDAQDYPSPNAPQIH